MRQMRQNNLRRPFQHTYSQSYRNMYQGDLIQKIHPWHSQRQERNNILLQYEISDYEVLNQNNKKKPRILSNQSVQNKKQNKDSHKKYSFSMFLQLSKQKMFLKTQQSENKTKQNLRKNQKDNKDSRDKLKQIIQSFRKSEDKYQYVRKDKNTRVFLNVFDTAKKSQNVTLYATSNQTKNNDDKLLREKVESSNKINFSLPKYTALSSRVFKGSKYKFNNYTQNSPQHYCGKKAQFPLQTKKEAQQEENTDFLRIQSYSLGKRDKILAKASVGTKKRILREGIQKQNKNKCPQMGRVHVVRNKVPNNLSSMRKGRKNHLTQFPQQRDSLEQIKPW